MRESAIAKQAKLEHKAGEARSRSRRSSSTKQAKRDREAALVRFFCVRIFVSEFHQK
jgi:hypothetical protein